MSDLLVEETGASQEKQKEASPIL